MFYQFILDHSKNNTYTSIKPTHHIQKYYQEIKQLNEDDVITLLKPCKRVSNGRNDFVFTPATWEILDLDRLKLLASTEQVKPHYHFQKGKLISYLNKYNSQPWTNGWTRLKFNKGRCNGEVAWRTTENSSKGKQDRVIFNDITFGDSNWCHYDVPSSIPQIIYLMNHKKWLNKRVWDLTHPEVKSMGQRIMFCLRDYDLARSFFQFYKNKNNVSPSKTKYWGEFFNGVWVESEYTEYETMMDLAKQRRQELESIIGKLPGKTKKERNQVFIHESNIYLMVLNKFIDAGAKVYQVYDSFYWNKDSGITSEQVSEWVKECAEYYINNYDEIMAKEELIFSQSTIQHRLTQKEKRNEYASNQNWYDAVRKWVKRNPGSINFPKKWTEQQIELANKLIGGNI